MNLRNIYKLQWQRSSLILRSYRTLGKAKLNGMDQWQSVRSTPQRIKYGTSEISSRKIYKNVKSTAIFTPFCLRVCVRVHKRIQKGAQGSASHLSPPSFNQAMSSRLPQVCFIVPFSEPSKHLQIVKTEGFTCIALFQKFFRRIRKFATRGWHYCVSLKR